MAKTQRIFQDRELDRHELELSLFACIAILVLAAGLATLMYPAVFSERQASRTPQIAFIGFCGLSVLLIAYIIDRQLTIGHLRREMELDRKRASDALARASDDLLVSMPDLAMFKDRLAMEFRRAAVAKLSLSVVVVRLHTESPSQDAHRRPLAIAEAAKATSRMLREQDSIYNLGEGCFGIVLPGLDQAGVRKVRERLSTGLAYTAETTIRFSFLLDSISYPEETATAHYMETTILSWLPESGSQLLVPSMGLP